MSPMDLPELEQALTDQGWRAGDAGDLHAECVRGYRSRAAAVLASAAMALSGMYWSSPLMFEIWNDLSPTSTLMTPWPVLSTAVSPMGRRCSPSFSWFDFRVSR